MTAFRVLHIEDEPDIRAVVEISLGLDPDVEMRSCSSGQEALAVAAEWQPDIILLDVMMPVMDGPATLARLRANPQTVKIPVVFMTARAQGREIENFLSLGAVGVIPKPFDPMTLAASIRAYVKPANDPLDSLRNVFLVRAGDDAAKLAGHRAALTNGTTPPATLAGIQSIAHSLAGAGGIFGFDEISDTAAALEEAVIVELKLNGLGTAEGIATTLDRLLACIEATGSRKKEPPRSQLVA